MREVTDAVLIMVLPLKSVMSSSLCNVSRNRYLAITLAKLSLVEARELSPVSGVRNCMGHPPLIVVKVHTLFFFFSSSFLRIVWCYF